ncbi:hypothetical protein IAU60_000220 [Kwoniella sp. DSM 27419]
MVTEATEALTSLQVGHQPIPLPTPSPVPHVTGGTLGGTGTVLSPPTPAPSPSPAGRQTFRQDESDEESSVMLGNNRGKGGRADPSHAETLLASFSKLAPTERFSFLSGLIGELRLNEALVMSRRIEPLLRRDFLRELPIELSLHCLSFVDEPRTLARSAQVSRYWNTLLQDEQTWRDLLDRHQSQGGTSFVVPKSRGKGIVDFTAKSGPDGTAQSQSRSKATSTPRRRSEALANLPRHSAHTPFGIERRLLGMALQRPGADANGTFKTRFKKAYLTESNWIYGGLRIATHECVDEAVVTTLCFDDNYIVIGMANAKVHVFDAVTGTYMKTLLGHRQGVWAMVLVSSNRRGSPALDEEDDLNSRSRKGYAGSAAQYADDPYYGRTSNSYRDHGQSRRSSFAGHATERHPPLGSDHSTSSVFDSPRRNDDEQVPSQPARPNTAMGFTPMPSAGVFGLGIGTSEAQTGSDPRLAGFEPGKRARSSDPCGSARGWLGNKYNLVVSAGCDREVKVWNVDKGVLVHSLRGHTSTIRCLKVLDRRPIAVSGSRDHTVRVWDIEKGELLHTLTGHEESVRCVEIAGNMAVSGSYDYTARLWNLDTGACVHVLRGHYHQIYSVAFDGVIVITGSLDSTIRVWSAATGECLALLQGHTALVGQLQLSDFRLVTGGSDGRVIIFDLSTLTTHYRLCAHDNSVTCLQFDDKFIVSGGNDGRVKLWDVRTGRFIRELTRPCDAVWRVGFRSDRVVLLCQREGRTFLEVITFRPGEGEKKLRASR